MAETKIYSSLQPIATASLTICTWLYNFEHTHLQNALNNDGQLVIGYHSLYAV